MENKKEKNKDEEKMIQAESSIQEGADDNSVHSGPSDDCNCPVCIFAKSQAPGQPYDLSKCPKYNSSKKGKKSILQSAIEKITERLDAENLLDNKVTIRAKVLSAEEAIGNPERDDFPLLKGKEKIVEANFRGHLGHAFTDMYGGFEGRLKDIFYNDSSNNYRRSLQVCTINALMHYWKEVLDTVHCKDEWPSICARKSLEFIEQNYPKISRIAFIGYQPAIIDVFSKKYVLKVLDLDKDNIGEEKCGNIILDGNKYMKDAAEWSELILATGSTIINGTIDDIISAASKDKVIFYGVTIAGVAHLMGLNRMCFLK